MVRIAWSYVRRHHLGLLALFVALGGTSYAATQLERNSVGSKQLRKGAVRTVDIRNGAVTLRKIRGATRRALRGSRGAMGPAGPAGGRGHAGPKGDRGPTGPPGQLGPVVMRFVEFTVEAESFSSQEVASCLPGERVVSGGVGFAQSPGTEDRVMFNAPGTGEGNPEQGDTPTTWEGTIYNSEAGPKTARVYAVCAEQP